jgi:hypothetical protein
MDTAYAGEWLGLHTSASKKCLVEQLSQWKSEPHQLQHLCGKYTAMKQALQKQPTLFSECEQVFQDFAHMETEVEKLLSNSDLEKESYNEILFLKPMFQPLNFVPFILMIWSVLRIYLFPGLALLVPFLTLLAPYFLLTFVLEVPITFHRYRVLLQSMLSGNTQALLDPLALAASPASSGFSSSSFVQTAKQCGMAIFTIIQGILQPYWTHQHLSTIDHMIQTKGALLMRCRERYERLATLLESAGCVPFRCPLPTFSSEREAVAHAILSPFYFKMMLKVVGSLEVLVRLAHHPDLHPVRWVSSATPVFRAKDTFDFRVPVTQRKPISVRMDTKRHALLTGPNKGGKSTVLRALAASALFAHTYGCAMGHVTMTPFRAMYVCLTPDDLPGSKSRFEREIEFTAQTLRHGDQPLLVFMDELFHSTNPPDALRSCEIYCHQLWNKQQIVSIISTHLFDFVERAAPTVQRLCCPATMEKGEVRFSYELVEGICKVSSVDSLLQQNGMDVGALRAPTPLWRHSAPTPPFIGDD